MFRTSTNHRRRSFVPRLGVLVGAVSLLVLSLVAVYPAIVRAQDRSVAGDHAEVVAQGVSTLTGDRLAWRVVQDSAEPAGTAEFQQRALGFAVATNDTFLQTEQSTGQRTLVEPGEAVFSPNGAYQSRESQTVNPVSYVRIGLVAESEASDAQGDTLIYAGDGFDVTAGDFDIQLIGVKLAPNETTTLATTGTSLVFVTEGSADLGSETLDAGEAISIEGAVQIQAHDAAVRAYVATVGAAVAGISSGQPVEQSPVSSDQPTETGGDTGSIVIQSVLCPTGTTLKQVQATESVHCAGGGGVSNMTVQVTAADSGDSQSLDIDPSSGEALFQDLAPGDYAIDFLLPEGYSVALGTCGGMDNSSDLPVVTVLTSSTSLTLPADRQYLCVIQVLQPDAAAETSGSLSASFFACPAGMTYDDLDTSQCDLITDGFDFGFQGDFDVDLSDATLDNGAFTWTGLTLSPDQNSGVAYSPIVYAFPDGYDAYGLSTDSGVILMPQAGGYVLTPDEPAQSVDIYFFSS